MQPNPWFRMSVVLCLLGILAAGAACGGDDDDNDDEYPKCERDTELVFDAQVDFDGVDRFFRFWLDENDDDFLSGQVRDLETGNEYPTLGETQGKNSYVVTFSPGPVYLSYLCPQSLSLTLDLKNLSGTLAVYCQTVKLDERDAAADVLCDETGITLDES